MAVQKDDRTTSDLPGLPRKRGRPATGRAKSAAERVRAFRARQSAEGPKRGPAWWSDIEQVTHDICVAVFSYLDGDQVRAKMETFRGIDNYRDAGRWLYTMKSEYLEDGHSTTGDGNEVPV